jgi:SRSO17 transposase
VAAGQSVDPAGWQALFDELMSRIAGRFARVEPRRAARDLVLGLLSAVERKNCWWLAQHAGHRGPQVMQRLLRTARWDADAVRDDVRAFVTGHLGHPDGVLIADETGFLKKGMYSVGVQRQYSGTAGRVENCQVGVFLSYASARGRALVDRRVYLPRSWTDEPVRCAAAGIPDQVAFATKPELALAMVADAVAAGVPARWVAADELYGDNTAFREGVARLGWVMCWPSRSPCQTWSRSPRFDGLKVSNQAATRPGRSTSRGHVGDHLTAQRDFRCPRAGTQLSVDKDFFASASTPWRPGLPSSR